MADAKITDLTALTTPDVDDVLPVVDDPAGTPVTKKIKVQDLAIPKTVKITSDLASTTTTALGDASGLSFAVKSGVYYRFSFLVLYQAAATTTGIKLSVSTPSVTVVSAVVSAPVSTAADGTANIFRGHITTSDDAVTGTGTPATAQTITAEVTGTILPSADGNLQLRIASEISGSGITVKQGSNGLLWKLP